MKLLTIAWAAGCVLAPAAVLAQDAPPATGTGPTAEALRVTRDPVTGQLRPAPAKSTDAARAKTLAPLGAAKGMPSAPVAKQHANGMRSVVLSPQQLSALKAERRPDGSLAVDHDMPARSAQPQALPLE